ncbi:hypothetical protein J3R30DRAFT_3701119 [Lentinula aciculospora]|uniref:Uncharacterized protein n=1 Tax=Lentinula aciculospora TaxID=153920 RepID=A0A9W9AD59_9AGAR|nr:hypothetical protein J3R30DRAFT_3701119 [Lentinula aciculospora]
MTVHIRLYQRQGGQPPLPQPNPSSLPPPKPQKNKQKLSHTDCEDESEAMDAQSSATSSRTKLLSSKSSYKVQDNELEAMEIEDSQETDSVKGTSSSSVRSGFIFKKNGQGSKDHKKNRSEVKQEHQQDSEESNEEPTAALADESLSFLTSGKRKRIYITSSDEESSLIPRRRNRENSRITTLISPIPATEEDRKTPKQILIPRKKNHTSRWNGGSRKSFPLKSVASIHREKLGMSDTQEGILPESHISHSVIALSVAPHVQSFPNESFPTANAPSAMLLSPASSEVVGNAASLPPASGTNGSPTTCPPSSQLASSHMKPIRSASPPSAASGSPPDLPAPSASQSSVVSSETIMPSPNPASSTRLHSYKKPALSLLSVPPFSASTSVIVSPTSSLPPPQTVVASTVPSTSPLPVPSPTLQRDPQSQMQSRFDWSNLLNDLYRLRMEEMRMLQGHHKA